MTVGQSFKKVRQAFGLTQKQAAQGAQLKYRSYQEYEGDNVVPPATAIIALADFFNVSTDYLLGRADNTDSVEQELVTLFRGLDTNERNALVKFAEYLRFSQAANPAVLKKALNLSPDEPQAEAGA